MWKALAINLTDIQGLMCAIIVRRLRDYEWPGSEIESISEKAIERCAEALGDEDRLQKVARDAAMMHMNGSKGNAIQEMASAAFAICAVRIADDLNSARYAEWN